MYLKGQGIEQNYAKALSLFQKAAENGMAAAQFVAALMYSRGDGVKQDYVEAAKWLEKAAQQGHQQSIDLLRELKKYKKIK
jgi:TPR repeat protein